MSEKDALDKLIVDGDENPNTDLLAEIVSNYLKFDKKTGEIIFQEKFYRLLGWQKTMIYLLGRKVVFVKKLQKDFSENISSKLISENLGIEPNHIRTYVSRNLKGIVKTAKQGYFIPNYNLYKCKEKLEKNGKSK